jgi:hypothetical protein
MPGEFYGIVAERILPFLQELEEGIDELLVSRHSFAILQDSRARNWQSGTATSGETGADLVSLGEAGKTKLIHSLLVDIGGLTSGAKITIKLFMNIDGVDRKLYPPNGTAFTVGTDPDGCWLITGTLAIHDVLRVEVQSDNAGDNGKSVAYTAVVENM